MPNYFVNLPAAQVPSNALMNFAPVNNALEGVRQQNNTNRQFAAQEDERTYQRGRDAKQDARTAKIDARAEVEWYGKAASAAARYPKGSPERARAWQGILRRHGGQGLTREEMHPDTGPEMLMAEAGLWRDPREDQIKDLEIQKTQAEIGAIGRRATSGPLAEFEARKVIAEQLGMQPGTPQYQTYVATGKTGRDETLTATDRKMIHQSEDEVLAFDRTIDRLKRAKELNPQTNQGYLSDTRATLANNLPDWAVPNAVSSPQSGEATREYADIMNLEAVKEMSQTLKGASTDREMMEFIKIVGDTTKPIAIRQRALERLLKESERQKALAESRSRDLRGGSYYKPGYAPDGAAAAAQEQPAQPETKVIGGKRYLKVDGQWFEQ